MPDISMQRFKPEYTEIRGFWFSIGLKDDTLFLSESVHIGFSPDVYRKLLAKAKLSLKEFHEITHIPISTVKRRLANNEHFSMQESDRMYRLGMLIKLSDELFQDEEKAQKWIREKVYGLEGKRPLDMITTSIDFEIVKDLIGRIEHGIFS